MEIDGLGVGIVVSPDCIAAYPGGAVYSYFNSVRANDNDSDATYI